MKVEVKKNAKSSKSAENSSVEDEDSDSFSDDSSSDSKTSKNQKRKIPQFSVSQSDSVGLRMKISAIHKTNERIKSPNNNNIRNAEKLQNSSTGKRAKRKHSAASSSSCCSVCSRSESECNSEHVKKDKTKKLRIKRKRINSEIVHEVKCNSASTDSDCDTNRLVKVNNSEGNVSQVKGVQGSTRKEHVHAIETLSTATEVTEVLPGGSCISSSDTELPALVNAAIKCVESCSESENHLSMEPKQYTSALLRDFMVKTQMLGNSAEIEQNKKLPSSSSANNDINLLLPESTKNSIQARKKRGRPKKNCIPENIVNESADSGVTSITQSLSPSPKNHGSNLSSTNTNKSTIRISRDQMIVEQKRENIQQIQKLSLDTLDKKMYATERVLYPPREKKKPPSKYSTKTRNSMATIASTSSCIKSDMIGENRNNIDPLWKKIDVNMKFRRPSLAGYKSDGGGSTICSKILAARSGYVSDYGSVGNKNYSGYKSDVSGKSRLSMRSCISRAKSCDYSRSNARNKKLNRKRRSSISQAKGRKVNEQDILQLAGLSLGQSSEENSRESIPKTSLSKEQSKIYGEINRYITTGEYFSRSKQMANFGDILKKQRSVLDGKEYYSSGMFLKDVGMTHSSHGSLTPFSKEFDKFSKRIRSRRSSAVSRCSSYSANSRHDIKKRRRRKMRYRLQSRNGYIDSKLNTDIEILTNSFPALCKITSDKNTTGKDRDKFEKDKGIGSKAQNKRNQKKKKQNDTSEHHHQHHTSNTTLKRRHKKTAHASPDDHKLPLKKRHYLLTPGEKSDGKNMTEMKSGKDASEVKMSGKNLDKTGGKSVSKAAVTPKKRHLLETTVPGNEEGLSKLNHQSATTSGNDSKLSLKATEDGNSSAPQKVQGHTKGDSLTKKKNRLEGLLSKIHNAASTSSSRATTPSTKEASMTKSTTELTPGYPPPGVFEPSEELEIQIPLVKLTAEGIITKCEVESPKVSDLIDVDKILAIDTKNEQRLVESLLNKTATVNLLLKRKRKKPINRTGFPSLKKKKRKVVEKINSTEEKNVRNENNSKQTTKVVSESTKKIGEKLCDRVPHAGEASDTFLERNNKIPRLSVVSLDRLQDPQKKSKETANATSISTATEPTTVISSRKAGFEQKLTVSVDKEKLKNNLRSSPNRGNNVSMPSPLPPDRQKKANEKKETDKNRKRTISKEKPANPCSSKTSTVNKKESEKAQIAIEKTVRESSKSKNKNNEENKNSQKGKNKRLTSMENKKNLVKPTKKKISKENIDEEAKAVVKQTKKLKKETSQQQITNKKNMEKQQQNKNATSRKISSSTNESQTTITQKVVKKDTITTDNFTNSEELEQEPLPPLDVNEIVAESTEEMMDESDCTVKVGRKTSKWKKNYLTSGLFSDSYKSSRARKNAGGNKNGEKNETNEVTETPNTSANSSTISLLPPPPYCEKFFRRTVQDFLLPYDVWWAYKNSKLPTKAMVPSWNYKKIRTNVYGDVRRNLVFARQQCTCRLESGCGDDCLNRMVYAECSPANCPCGDRCTNQKIQRHEISPGIERFMTQNKGWGVRTALYINKGTYILEYVGEVVTEKEFKERMATMYANDTHHYCLHLDGGLVIDGHRMGSDGRFVNHSCSPNCEMQKWSVNGLSRMALFALRDIEPGEELTYDYNFSLFNPSEGQLCRCETPQCRGVIGGKSQRVKPFEQKITEIVPSNAHSRSRKRQAKKNSGRIQSKDVVTTNLQQPSDREKKIIKAKNCFLIRSLEKVRRLKMKSIVKPASSSGVNNGTSSRPSTPSSLAAQISALLRVPRNIQTRVLTQAVTDPEVEKMAKLAAIFREICVALESVKDGEDKSLITKLTAASKKKQSSQDRNFTKLIDFPTVQGNVEKGHYKTPEAFDEDVNSVFANAINYFEPGAEETLIVKRLSKEYTDKKKELYSKLVELIGEKSSKSFRIGGKGTGVYNTHEDVIRCICGLFKDEGLMIQCSKCLVWQHTECTKANVNEENYLCERCEPRKVDLEIPLEEFTEENYRYYLSLLRGDLQIRQGDTVYVLRDIPIKDEDGNVLTTKKHTYETIGKIDFSECDIFRVERLWKDNDGKRFIFGHHYLRPHETFHEPSRKFYENEVVRVPLYEVIPIELVIARCWVLDRKTFCMGRPVDCSSEEHVYICELRVNKTARLFAKNKQAYPICTKNYAFRRFKDKLHISRTYAPHDVDPSLVKRKRKANETSSSMSSTPQNQQQQQKEKKAAGPVIQLMPPPPKTINEKRVRLENILKNLRLKQDILPTACPPVDLSYLLTGRGARQRRANATIVPL